MTCCRYVDEGGNPDDYTVNFFHRANRGNQLAKGKSEAFVAFRSAFRYPSRTFGYLLKQKLSPKKSAVIADWTSAPWFPTSRHILS